MVPTPKGHLSQCSSAGNGGMLLAVIKIVFDRNVLLNLGSYVNNFTGENTLLYVTSNEKNWGTTTMHVDACWLLHFTIEKMYTLNY